MYGVEAFVKAGATQSLGKRGLMPIGASSVPQSPLTSCGDLPPHRWKLSRTKDWARVSLGSLEAGPIGRCQNGRGTVTSRRMESFVLAYRPSPR